MQRVRVGSQMPQIAQRSPRLVLVTRRAATNPPTTSSPEIQPIAMFRFSLRVADKCAPVGKFDAICVS